VTIVRSYSVFCDGDVCGQWYGEITNTQHRSPVTETRRIASLAGWTRQQRDGRKVDLCPRCS